MVIESSRCSVKFLSFKLSRVRYVSQPEVQQQELVVTGSWMEEVNRLCLWRFDYGEQIDSGRFKPTSEQEDGVSPGVLGDSADDPRLVHSIVHTGWVQDLKVHRPTQLIVSASSTGTLEVCRTDDTSMKLSRLTSPWMPFGQTPFPSNLPIALSTLSLSSDGKQVYVGDDLGRLAAVQLDRLPVAADGTDAQIAQQAQPMSSDFSPISQTGADIASVNALERVDASSLAGVNQLGQLKVWDLRCGLDKPQQRLIRPSETQPLYCLSHHPGQPHLLAVGGVEGSGTPAYIWDLRADQYPLTEVACQGRSVWEVGFHPRQPQHLYLATETAGLLQISCRNETGSWTGFKGSRRKLVVGSALPTGTTARNVISFDMTNTQLICGHSDAILQTTSCETFS
ncbi:Nucleoporin Nup43 [Clonorchis sinensis]|uniref:Nucleoporin Nup43 n=1 Tax=Clonorchis sinensis TaxID=79923 RepID=A0A3R7G8Y8_CLOSI|nr:Nucleoporin Nup43 [Clonorchis sinensis]